MAVSEKEITLYCQLSLNGEHSLDAFSSAENKEEHVQIGSNFSTGVPCRVRKTIKNGLDPKYVFTYKVRVNEKDKDDQGFRDSREHNKDVDESFFNDFFRCGKDVQYKTRYTFKAPVIDIEVTLDNDETKTISFDNCPVEYDVYKDSPWCKIDIEVNKIEDYLEKNKDTIGNVKTYSVIFKASKLPIKYLKIIGSMTPTDEEKKMIDYIWENYFKKKVIDEKQSE